MGFTTRTMELYRAVGLGPDIPQVPVGSGRPRRLKVESLAGRWAAEEVAWTPDTARGKPDEKASAPVEYSICTGAALAQDHLEPILREKAIALGADLRASTTLTSFKQDTDGVTASLRAHDGSEYRLRADYMIAADGHSSPIREALGIGRSGRGELRTVRSVLFRAPLDQYLASGVSQFEIEQPDFTAMLTTYRDGRWLLMFSDDEDRDEVSLRAFIHRAIGRNDLKVEIITTGRWELSALIADRFSAGRVFLAGDAAHTLPPARGGYGANTGIEDAHNLAWKLSAVLSRESRPALLDTYDPERRPIAWLRHDQIFARPDYAQFAGPADQGAPIIDDAAMELGQLYRSRAILGAGEDLPPALRPEQWAGQPGARAPHVWVTVGGARVSTLDLVQPDWVLLTEDGRWCAVARAAAKQLALKLDCVVVGAAAGDGRPATDATLAKLQADFAAEGYLAPSPGSIDPGAFRRAFGLGPAGASLIRPDGYVAWRVTGFPPNATLEFKDILGRVAFASGQDKGTADG
jgi:2-polyprenyl-6-methoxyphenol hydroxylase-like FAD-dependent oxidoreductase